MTSWKDWTLAVLVLLVTGLAGVMLSSDDTRIETIEKNVEVMNAFHIAAGERLAKVETQYENINQKLTRIEDKVDELQKGG